MTNDNVSREGRAGYQKSEGAVVTAQDDTSNVRTLTPQAQRALAEAEERRRVAREAAATDRPREIHGRGGSEPVRFGDWEIKGLAVDF